MCELLSALITDESLELDNNSLQAEEGDRDSTKSTHDDDEDEGIIFIASSSPTPSEECKLCTTIVYYSKTSL